MRPPSPARLQIRADRRIAADPTSTALLLAAPGALELWPGLRRVGAAGGRVLVEAELPDQHEPAQASVQVTSPRRTPTSYVVDFSWSSPSLPDTAGQLTLGYACGEVGAATSAQIDLISADAEALPASSLQHLVEGFLGNLARLAESRSSAA
jgi:hypothetical protein